MGTRGRRGGRPRTGPGRQGCHGPPWLTPPDQPDDPDLPANRGQRPAPDPTGVDPLISRPLLTSERVVEATVDHVDTQGLPALTMRRLRQHLGVEAMSLYHHVEGREDLLDAVATHVVDELHADPDVHLEPLDGWQDHLRRLAHGVRRIALAHPALFPLVATRPSRIPWARPPLRSLTWIEFLFSALLTHGFTPGQAVVAYRVCTGFPVGHLLLEVAHRGPAVDDADGPGGASRTASAELRGHHPLVAALEPLLSLDGTTADLEDSLASLLARLGAMVDPDRAHS